MITLAIKKRPGTNTVLSQLSNNRTSGKLGSNQVLTCTTASGYKDCVMLTHLFFLARFTTILGPNEGLFHNNILLKCTVKFVYLAKIKLQCAFWVCYCICFLVKVDCKITPPCAFAALIFLMVTLFCHHWPFAHFCCFRTITADVVIMNNKEYHAVPVWNVHSRIGFGKDCFLFYGMLWGCFSEHWLITV